MADYKIKTDTNKEGYDGEYWIPNDDIKVNFVLKQLDFSISLYKDKAAYDAGSRPIKTVGHTIHDFDGNVTKTGIKTVIWTWLESLKTEVFDSKNYTSRGHLPGFFYKGDPLPPLTPDSNPINNP